MNSLINLRVHNLQEKGDMLYNCLKTIMVNFLEKNFGQADDTSKFLWFGDWC